MSRYTPFRPFFLVFFSAAMACSAADGRVPLVPVEFHKNGFSVGQVSYTGTCEATAYEQCRSDNDDCLGRCSGLSTDLYVSCARICRDYDCSGKSDVCVDYEADFDFGPPNPTLAAACNAWATALETSCGVTRAEGRCERVATTWRPEFASVFDCSAEQTRRGVCADSCYLPASNFGDELCREMDADPAGCKMSAPGNLLGGVLRDDVIEAAYACLTFDDTYLGECLHAWQVEAVP